MAVRSFQIFKAGNHISMDGSARHYSSQELRRCAVCFNMLKEAQKIKTPCVLGHEHERSFGEVLALEERNESLYAVAEVGSTLLDLVRAKRYKKVSASFFLPDHPSNPAPGVLFLRHVGFLGAMPPAVKGLEALEFSEESSIAFSEHAGSDIVSGFAGAFAATAYIPDMTVRERIALATFVDRRQHR